MMTILRLKPKLKRQPDKAVEEEIEQRGKLQRDKAAEEKLKRQRDKAAEEEIEQRGKLQRDKAALKKPWMIAHRIDWLVV